MASISFDKTSQSQDQAEMLAASYPDAVPGLTIQQERMRRAYIDNARDVAERRQDQKLRRFTDSMLTIIGTAGFSAAPSVLQSSLLDTAVMQPLQGTTATLSFYGAAIVVAAVGGLRTLSHHHKIAPLDAEMRQQSEGCYNWTGWFLPTRKLAAEKMASRIRPSWLPLVSAVGDFSDKVWGTPVRTALCPKAQYDLELSR